MDLYAKVLELCKGAGISVRHLEREAGLTRGAIDKWKVSSPSVKNLSKVAQYFDVSLDALMDSDDGYYLDGDAVRIAQELKDRPQMKILFDATRNVSADDLEFIIRLVDNMQKH